ncbi:transketolase [Rhodococcus sp. D2-41]|uniref:Transketolase n=1 Tax=Speluncibacter jeojiensis TaxID=2710754 RepID=A0A9X4REP3_9ACTN|nr:transketolase [Rhodococcus sp. D2-41]MDG3008946.1 transketolase [Rhodococcus sp. D2-41]MDG3015457.1 transketolase [Corynebacteriales bacterium D3-21]
MTTSSVATTRLERGRPASVGELRNRADWLRLEVIDMIDGAGLGHYSSTFSCAEILAVLYYRAMRLDPARPDWADRDRFLLGKGHAAVGLWPILADLGYFDRAELDRFGYLGSNLGDHPDMRKAAGVDFSSGSLGHNLSVGVGMAMAARLHGSDHRTFVLTGDGEIHEGQVWEAAMAASHYRLGNLVAIVDANGYIGSGPTSELMGIEPLADRFAAFGWRVVELDGHDVAALVQTLDGLPAPDDDRPVCIVARTQKGRGVSIMEQAPRAWHVGCLTPEQREAAVAEVTTRMQRETA